MDTHIKRLQDTIYPRIDAFIRDTKSVISAELNADITNYTLEQVKDLAGTLKGEMDTQVRTATQCPLCWLPRLADERA